MQQNYLHRNFGVYGVCLRDQKLLVINKTAGPYINRYDLPGGNIEQGETLISGLHREFMEEARSEIKLARQIGIAEYLVPFPLTNRGTSHIHHIAVFYLVEFIQGDLSSDKVMNNNDSGGAIWKNINELDEHNSSPLVMEAKKWLSDTSSPLPVEVQDLQDWIIRSSANE
ncbi:NUDIX hydrolase [Paenibacillus illinoisensis]|uniref:NUDIX hydrolase n=1 Tax=Paenibacillus illinoisensis TaxID=59845 RepID=UPI0030199AF1